MSISRDKPKHDGFPIKEITDECGRKTSKRCRLIGETGAGKENVDKVKREQQTYTHNEFMIDRRQQQ